MAQKMSAYDLVTSNHWTVFNSVVLELSRETQALFLWAIPNADARLHFVNRKKYKPRRKGDATFHYHLLHSLVVILEI